ncbi:hypothetical protein [Nafulsella turpanensis]|uniref:hypothetical protein n=1 Tax=Nafulsella turpanensis TaxID=1265690 RepID=UPI000380ECD2|nr:hypothetical protein [Nafulsella turpanensis]
MPFNIEELDRLIPEDLAEQKKDRLRNGLKQFHSQNLSEAYSDFYSTADYSFFLQGDVVREIRFPVFDFISGEYSKGYFDAILLSNTCDMDEGNQRNVKKNIIIAKVIPLQNFIDELSSDPKIKNANEIAIQVKSQLFSNVLYLPPTIGDDNQEYIAFLDDIAWISIEELANLKDGIDLNRLVSLDFLGYYLFVFKLSYHLLRLPEETHR